MLKKIPKLLSPELVRVMMEMGHGDELVLADANYPGHSLNSKVLRYDGIGIPDLLDAILELLPLGPHTSRLLPNMTLKRRLNMRSGLISTIVLSKAMLL